MESNLQDKIWILSFGSVMEGMNIISAHSTESSGVEAAKKFMANKILNNGDNTVKISFKKDSDHYWHCIEQWQWDNETHEHIFNGLKIICITLQ